MSRRSKIITVLVLVLNLGLHWALLQSVAWVSMIVHYSQSRPLLQAVVMTFDGDHPCALCSYVSEGRQREREQQQHQFPMQKLESVALDLAPFRFLTPESESFRTPAPLPGRPPEAPPSPPPRLG